jgi:phosphoesterase RecJ-like protein
VNRIEDFIRLFKTETEKKIVITTHHKPDADALGSSLGLYNYLKTRGYIHVQVITPTDYGTFLNWMHGNEKVIIYDDEVERSNIYIAEADYIFCLDFNNLSRINQMGDHVSRSEAIKIMIDHHQQPDDFALYGISRTSASSTAELIYDFIAADEGDLLINKEVAECLYAGILTDTGNFRHDTTNAHTHRIVARLIECGANSTNIQSALYDNFSLERMQFIGYCLAHKLEILEEYKTALITVNAEELKKYNIKTGDTEGLVNYGLSIKGIKLAILVIDRTVKVKMSFRGQGTFPCNLFSKEYFNGGGHFNAAGGESEKPLDEVVNEVKHTLINYKKYLI